MKYEGWWHITTMEIGDADSLKMEVQAFIRIKRGGGGEVQFGLVSGQIDGEVVKTAAGERFEFTWEGNDGNVLELLMGDLDEVTKLIAIDK